MKKLLRLQSVFMLLLFFVAITGCNKDDDDNGGGGDNPAQTNYRMTEDVYAEDGVESTKDVYSYESDKLSQIMEYKQATKGDWFEDNKTVVSYPSDNSFEMLTSDYAAGAWNPSSKEVVTHQNGIWQSDVTYSYFGSDWSMTEKVEYTYSNGKITKEEGFVYPAGQEENEYKNIYSYVGDVPSTVDNYLWTDGAWESTGKDTLTFSNGKLVKIELNTTIQGVSVIYKYEIEYSGDNVSKMTFKYKYGEMWMEIGSIVLTYDEHGNLIKEEGLGDMNFSDTYAYEEGNSNWALINGAPGYVNFYGMGFSKSFEKINNEVNKIALSALSQR